jgi:hypothetical protein
MRRVTLRGKVVALLLALTLAVPWCAAAASTSEPPDLVSQLWQLFASLWGDIGCHIDPNGGCSSGTTDQGDTGCHIDPSGGCRDAVTVEPPATSNGDTGCHLDPNGGCGG